MIIHTSAEAATIQEAAKTARAKFGRFNERGSRKRPHAFDITLTGESARAPNGGRRDIRQGRHAATWDQWGVFLAQIFAADPDATATYYADADDFHRQTAHRFENGWPTDAHGDHAWESNYPAGQACKRCTAERRWPER